MVDNGAFYHATGHGCTPSQLKPKNNGKGRLPKKPPLCAAAPAPFLPSPLAKAMGVQETGAAEIATAPSGPRQGATVDARYDSITMAAVRITTHTTPSTMNSLAPNFNQVV